MGKLYTLDGKMLIDVPEIRIGDKVYKVDNRVKTVEKINSEKIEGENIFKRIERVLVLLLGMTAVKEINFEEMPMPAAKKLMELAVAAATGEEPEHVDKRFQEASNEQQTGV